MNPVQYPHWKGFIGGVDVSIKLIGHHYIIKTGGKTLIIPESDVRVRYVYSTLRQVWDVQRIENLIGYL